MKTLGMILVTIVTLAAWAWIFYQCCEIYFG